MRAAVLVGAGRVQVVDDWPEPTCAPDEVVVAIRGVGVCGSDLTIFAGHRAVPALPWVLGHEAVGQIVAVGAGVTDRAVGQRVVIEPNYPCLDCEVCRAGRTSACPRRRIVGVSESGLLVHRAAVPSRFTWPAPDQLADEDLVCTEPYAVAASAVRRAGVQQGQRCLVSGAGSQGLLSCLAVGQAGGVPYVTDPHEGRVALAVHLGARPADPDGGEYPVVIETSGVPAALESAVLRAAPGGTIAIVGQSTQPSRLASFDIAQRQLTLRGCLIYDHPDGFRSALGALRHHGVRPGQVVRARFPLSAAQEAFATARATAGKSWITVTDEKGRR